MDKPTNGSTPSRNIKRIAIVIAGWTVLAAGIAMIVLPGPAVVVIPAGLGILAMEYPWARRWLHKAGDLLRRRKKKEQA